MIWPCVAISFEMADAPKDMPEKGRTLITNIGLLLTGDLDAPIADSDCLLIEDGKIMGFEAADADRKIDAASGFWRLDAPSEPNWLD